MKTEPAVPPSSLDLLQAEAEAHPQDARAQLRLGWALYGAGRYERAARLLQLARDRSPQDLEVLYLLGLTFKRLGDRARAVQAFQALLPVAALTEDSIRGTMLRRLAVGHVNIISQGAWDLEPETWERR
jgi:Flp pilus assembly protein TadD